MGHRVRRSGEAEGRDAEGSKVKAEGIEIEKIRRLEGKREFK